MLAYASLAFCEKLFSKNAKKISVLMFSNKKRLKPRFLQFSRECSRRENVMVWSRIWSCIPIAYVHISRCQLGPFELLFPELGQHLRSQRNHSREPWPRPVSSCVSKLKQYYFTIFIFCTGAKFELWVHFFRLKKWMPQIHSANSRSQNILTKLYVSGV